MGGIAAIAPAVIGAAGSIVGNIIGGNNQQKANDSNWENQKEMYAWQTTENRRDWAMQNEYNSPRKQMERYQEAGLNPNLIYGQASANVSQPIKGGGTGSPSHQAHKPDLSGVGNAVNSYISNKAMEAQVNNLEVQNTVQLQRVLLEAMRTGADVANTEANTNTTNAVRDYQADALRSKRDLDDSHTRSNDGMLPYLQEQAKSNTARADADTLSTLSENERRTVMQSYSIQEALQRIVNMRVDSALTQAKTDTEREHIKQVRASTQDILNSSYIKDLDSKIKESGMQPHDNYFMRGIDAGMKKLQQGLMRLRYGKEYMDARNGY